MGNRASSAGRPKQIVDSRGRPMSAAVARELNTARLRVRSVVVADRMWNRLFTDADRRQLGGNLAKSLSAHGTIEMWMQARGVSLERAVVEIANGLDLMSDKTASWLLRELGEEEPSSLPPDRPHWDSSRGQLLLGGEVIRTVRVMKYPSNIQKLLDAFQVAGWPPRIPNPLGNDQHQLHLALQSMKRGLKAISFHGQEGGRAVTWTHVTS